MKNKIVYVDIDNVLVDFKSALNILNNEDSKILETYKDKKMKYLISFH